MKLLLKSVVFGLLAWGAAPAYSQDESTTPAPDLPAPDALPALEDINELQEESSSSASETDPASDNSDSGEALEPEEAQPEMSTSPPPEETAAPAPSEIVPQEGTSETEVPDAEASNPEGEAVKPDEVESVPEAPAPSENAEVSEETEEEVEEAEASESAPPPPPLVKAETLDSGDRYNSDFGSYRVAIGAGRPEFGDSLKYYEDLYGKPKIHPDFWVDYYFFDWYATLGVGFRGKYYRAEGKALNRDPGSGPVTTADIDEDSNTELVLIPLQAVATMEITPWRTSFFTINAWTGVEKLYVQETRHTADTTTTTGTSDTDDDGPSTYVNKGWNTGTVVGASLSLKMDYFDRASTNSLDILGLRSVYITPYVEIVKTNTAKVAKFDRTTMGILFTFESIN